jgi:transposase
VNKRFRVCGLDQPFLLPPSLQDWLPEDHLARFIADVTNELDLSAIYAQYQRQDSRGLSAYHPLLLTRLLLYGYCVGVTSSRRIERATHDDVAFRYLAADQHPDHDTIAAFRRQHLEALAGLFVQALRLCQKAGLVKLGNVAIDGTKIMANASTRRSVSYERLTERERYWQETVARLLAEAEHADEQEDQRWGKGQPANPLPAELARAQSRLERLRQAKAELERESRQQLDAARQNYTPRKRGRPRKEDAAAQPGQDPEERKKARNQFRRAQRNAEEPTRQYNFVDRLARNEGQCPEVFHASLQCAGSRRRSCPTIEKIREASEIAPVELEILFTVVNGGLVWHQDHVFQILQQIRHNDDFFVEIFASDVAEIKKLCARLEQSQSQVLDISPFLRQLTGLKALPYRSPLRFLGYFALLEALLTHSPKPTDPYDSITRQVKKKLTLLNHRWFSKIDYTPFGKTPPEKVWEKMYGYRSDVAHGNLPDFKKELTALKSEVHALRLLKETTKAVVRFALDEPELLADLRGC